MGISELQFRNEKHQSAFFEMVSDMYLSDEEMSMPSSMLKRQLAFSYLIALYQEDYARYEGDIFYIEMGEELSLGGPTYLLDERYGERARDCEKIIPIACRLLGNEPIEEVIEEEKSVLKSFILPIHNEISDLLDWIKEA